jgi:antirestriction protein ArdC
MVLEKIIIRFDYTFSGLMGLSGEDMKYQEICSKVTDQFIEMIEADEILPWQKPWKSGLPPTNIISKKLYKGYNSFFLGCTGFSNSYWGTFNQINKMKGKVNKGEKGYPIIFWTDSYQKSVIDKVTGEKKKISVGIERPILKCYTIFNMEQTNLVDQFKTDAEPQIEFKPLLDADKAIEKACSMGKVARIEHGEPRAYYSPGNDLINLPEKDLFCSVEEYYSTLLHECIHSTGHSGRLNRLNDGSVLNDTHKVAYSKEELVAELGSAFMMRKFNIEQKETFDNSAGYLKGWLSSLRGNPEWLVWASSKAQQSMNYILEGT